MAYIAALDDPDFKTPGKSSGLLDVFRHRYLLSLLVKKGIATRYYGSLLGWVWSYIRPAAQFLMYYLVVGLIMGGSRGIPAFPIYLFAGIITVNLFSEALRNTTNAITDNASLVKKIYLPRELFPVAALGVAFVHFLPQAVVLLVVCMILGWTISWLQLAALVIGIAVVLIFALGLGLFFGAINVGFRDARNVVDLILMFATWASPVLYSWSMVHALLPEWAFNLFMVNPMTTAVELMHNVFWLPLAPGSERPEHLLLNSGIGLVLALLTLLAGQATFRKLEGNFAQHL